MTDDIIVDVVKLSLTSQTHHDIHTNLDDFFKFWFCR